MKVSLALLSNLLLASAVVALPSGAERRARRALARQSKPFIHGPTADIIDNATHVSYSTNWAGVAITKPPSGTFTAVSATFNVPTPSPASSDDIGSWSGAVWVGIDGYNTDSIWQAGIDFTVTEVAGVKAYSYDAWYEWYPQDSFDFSDITISAGDKISVSCVTSSSTEGSVVLENLTTGKTVTKTVVSTSALKGKNAEWIVEAYEEDGSEVDLAKFNAVTFTDAKAKTSDGDSVGPDSGTVIDMETELGIVETDVTVDTSSELKITYV